MEALEVREIVRDLLQEQSRQYMADIQGLFQALQLQLKEMDGNIQKLEKRSVQLPLVPPANATFDKEDVHIQIKNQSGEQVVAPEMTLDEDDEEADDHLKRDRSTMTSTSTEIFAGMTTTWEFHFLKRAYLESLDCSAPLVHYQSLKDSLHLEKQTVKLRAIFTGELRKTHAAVSCRWEQLDRPDPSVERLKALQRLLKDNESITHVWWDFSCLPQKVPEEGDYSPEEKQYKDQTMSMLHLLYLGCTVFVLHDQEYENQFWPSVQAWMSLQNVSDVLELEHNNHNWRMQARSIGDDPEYPAAERLSETFGQWSFDDAMIRLRAEEYIASIPREKEVYLERLRRFADLLPEMHQELVPQDLKRHLKRQRPRLQEVWTERRRSQIAEDAVRVSKVSASKSEETAGQGGLDALLSRFISEPGSSFRLVWEMIGAILILWDCITVPLLVFDPPSDGFTEVINWVSLLFWTLDMGASLLVGYYKKGELEMRFLPILKKYISTWLFVDIVALVPDWIFTVVAVMNDTNKSQGGHVSQLTRVLRFIRIVRLVRLPRLYWLIENVGEKFNSEYIMVAVDIVVTVLLLLGGAHALACMWFLVGLESGDEKHNGAGTWVEVANLRAADWGSQYVSSLLWAVTQFVPASIDVYPQNNSERAYAILAALIAMVGFSGFVGSTTNALVALRKLKNSKTKEVNQVRRYLQSRNVPVHLGLRVQHYLERVLQKKRSQVEEPIIMRKYLSEDLRCELEWTVVSPIIIVHPLFKLFVDVERRYAPLTEMLRQLAHLAIETIHFAIDETLFLQDDLGKHMFVPISGRFQYNAKVDRLPDDSGEDTDKMTFSATQGIWLSEPVLWADDWYHRATVEAATKVEAFIILPKKFGEIIKTDDFSFRRTKEYALLFMKWIYERTVETPVRSRSRVNTAAASWNPLQSAEADVLNEKCLRTEALFINSHVFDMPDWARPKRLGIPLRDDWNF